MEKKAVNVIEEHAVDVIEEHAVDIIEAKATSHSPVRGSLRLSTTASSPHITAGSDFSIFVVIQNPFDVPLTIYQVQTHIPIELIDINGLRIAAARIQRSPQQETKGWYTKIFDRLLDQIWKPSQFSGIAIAVGTNFDPSSMLLERPFANSEMRVSDVTTDGNLTLNQSLINFSVIPKGEELDQIFTRIQDYQKGIIPVTLQPGNSVVRQFVLRTRNWLFFTPLTHTFQIQVNYSIEGKDHTETIAYEQAIRSTLGAVAIGAMVGAIIGAALKGLTRPVETSEQNVIQAVITSILASVIVVIAFARKSSTQPIISVEDFWGGMVIGFMTGFFGFEQFFGLFSAA